MRIKNRKLRITACIILIILLAFVLAIGGMGIAREVKIASIEDFVPEGKYKNIVFMIGDGMGFNHIETLKAYSGQSVLFMETAPVKGEAETFSKFFFGPTDSAASASALSTGKKYINGQIAKKVGKDIKSNTEFAIEKGMATGIIATEGVDGATPGSFSAHTISRSDKNGILADQLVSGIDLFIGTNSDRYGSRKAEIERAGYSYVDTSSGISAEKDKIFGVFGSMETVAANATDKSPSLIDVSLKAMDYLNAKSDSGFFLMIEESHIDKRSHANNMAGMLEHINAYDETIKAVVSRAKEIGDTLVIVTADHETGNLQYNGETRDEIGDGMFASGSHTSKNVPYFIFGEVGNLPKVIDNTNLFDIAYNYIIKR